MRRTLPGRCVEMQHDDGRAMGMMDLPDMTWVLGLGRGEEG